MPDNQLPKPSDILGKSTLPSPSDILGGEVKKKAVSQIGGFGSQLGSQTSQSNEAYVPSPLLGKTAEEYKANKTFQNIQKIGQENAINPKRKDLSPLDTVSEYLYLPAINKGFSEYVVKPLAGATDVIDRTIDKAYTTITGEKTPQWLRKSGAFDAGIKYYEDQYKNRIKPTNLASEIAEGTLGTLPLIAALATGEGEANSLTKAPELASQLTKYFTVKGTLNSYKDATDEKLGYIESLNKAAKGGLEGFKEGLTLDATMLVGGALGKGVTDQLLNRGLLVGGKSTEAVLHALAVGTTFAGTSAGDDLINGRDINTREALKQFGTGLAFELIPTSKKINEDLKDRSDINDISEGAVKSAAVAESASNLNSESAVRNLLHFTPEQVKQIHDNVKESKDDLYAQSIENGAKAYEESDPSKKKELYINQLGLKAQGDVKLISEKLGQNYNEVKDSIMTSSELSRDEKIDLITKIDLLKPKEAKENAVQEPSTSSEVPPVTEGGQAIQEGGERVGQGEQGVEVTKTPSTEEEVKVYEYNGKRYNVTDNFIQDAETGELAPIELSGKIESEGKLIPQEEVNPTQPEEVILEQPKEGVKTVKLDVNEDLANNGIGLRAVETQDGKFGIFKEVDGKVTGKSLGRSFDSIEELQSAYEGGIKDKLTSDAIKQAESTAQEVGVSEVKVEETPELTVAKNKLAKAKSEVSKKRLFAEVESISTPEQLNKLVQENPEYYKYLKTPVEEIKIEEPKITSLKNAEVAQKRADYGFDQPVEFKTKTNEETLSEANKRIDKGESVYNIIEKANNREPLNDVETAMLAVFQGAKEAELIDANKKIESIKDSGVLDFDKQVDARNKIIDDLIASYDASETSGNVAGLALQARKIKVLQDYSLANMLIKARKANGNAKLSDAKIENVTKAYSDLVEVKNKLNAKLDELREENQKLRLNSVAPELLRQAALEARDKVRAETKETLKAERDAIFKELSDIAKKSRSELSANPIKPEMLPVIARLAKNYFKEGAISVESVVDRLHNDLKNVIIGVSKSDVREALIDSQKDIRPSKDELIDELNTAKDDFKNAESEIGKDKSKLNAYKKSVQKRINEISSKIKNKDYSKKEVNKLVKDKEALALEKQYADIKFQFDVDLAKDKLNNRTKFEKYRDLGLEVANVPRALMASADLSAPLRQGLIPTISHPIMAAKAFKESLKQFKDPERAERWLSELKHSDGYQLMKDSGLYIADPKSVEATAKEEDFQTNLAEKIPGAGELVKASERSYVSYLNKMRVDLFTRGVDVLEADGKTFANEPEAYKALAKYVNASTGRGDLGALEGAAPYLNTVFFSPRLTASRLQLLTQWANPLYYKNTPASVRKMYFQDMGKVITFGLTVMALAKLNGAQVEDDPRSSDFGKIKVGDTRWDIWGGFQQPIRYMVQIASGQKKSSASGNIVELNGKNYSKETRLSTLSSFVRSKLSPIPGLAVDALAGENMIGEKFDIINNLPKLVTPLVWQGVYESAKNDGWGYGLGAVGVPSIFGVGVQTYGTNNFLQSGVDDKSIKLLQSKNATAIEPKEHDKVIYDVNKGAERDMTSDEFKKYYATWAGYIKDDLEANHDKYAKMDKVEFEKKFRSMKTHASDVAKEAISGISDDVLKIKTTVNGEPFTYELTPKEVKLRKKLNDQYKSENADFIDMEIERQISEGKSLNDARNIAKRKLESKANTESKKVILEKYDNGYGEYNFK